MVMAMEGIKILYVSSSVGPLVRVARLLGDLGAEVIKVESPPVKGTKTISSGEKGFSEFVRLRRLEVDRNMKSIICNLKSGEGRQIFYRLAEKTDVIIEGYRPGVAKRLGIDYETIKKINPRVIYCSTTGYGQTGPYSGLSGFSPNFLSMSGIQSLIGEKGRPPAMEPEIGVGVGGLGSLISILVGIVARQQTGKGQYIDISIHDWLVYMVGLILLEYWVKGRVPKPGESDILGGAPYWHLWETKNGNYISVTAMLPWYWEKLCRVLGKEEFIPDQWAEEKWTEMNSVFAGIFRTKTRDEWFDLLAKEDICVAPVLTLDEVTVNPHVLHRQMIVDVEDPTTGVKARQIGIPVKLLETPGRIRWLGHPLGTHTDEIMLDIGYSKKVIKRLRDRGVVMGPM